jgi:hypothetical protein
MLQQTIINRLISHRVPQKISTTSQGCTACLQDYQVATNMCRTWHQYVTEMWKVQSVLQRPAVRHNVLEYYRQQHQQEQMADLLKL